MDKNNPTKYCGMGSPCMDTNNCWCDSDTSLSIEEFYGKRAIYVKPLPKKELVKKLLRSLNEHMRGETPSS